MLKEKKIHVLSGIKTNLEAIENFLCALFFFANKSLKHINIYANPKERKEIKKRLYSFAKDTPPAVNVHFQAHSTLKHKRVK